MSPVDNDGNQPKRQRSDSHSKALQSQRGPRLATPLRQLRDGYAKFREFNSSRADDRQAGLVILLSGEICQANPEMITERKS